MMVLLRGWPEKGLTWLSQLRFTEATILAIVCSSLLRSNLALGGTALTLLFVTFYFLYFGLDILLLTKVYTLCLDAQLRR
jgi:hypothetical protein